MSSTVVSSLTTGVPVIADEAVLRAYSFLGHEDVFLMHKGEDEVDAMLRVRGGLQGPGRGPGDVKGVWRARLPGWAKTRQHAVGWVVAPRAAPAMRFGYAWAP
jgi:hypothetical protein